MVNTQSRQRYSSLGMGLSLKNQHFSYILEHLPPIDWFELITENFMVEGGNPLYYLEKIRAHYPVAMHGISLSIGSPDPLNKDYLHRLKQLALRIQPKWISDHICWTGVNQREMHDLLPLPYTEAIIRHVVERINYVQDFLQRQLLFENVSSYITYKSSEMTEWDFLSEIAQRADCFLLLDINNVYVSSYNHGFDPEIYLNHIPASRVQQFHLAGHSNCKDYIIDTHDQPIIHEVWELYEKAIRRFGDISTLIERDENIPPFEELQQELEQAKSIRDRGLSKIEAITNYE